MSKSAFHERSLQIKKRLRTTVAPAPAPAPQPTPAPAPTPTAPPPEPTPAPLWQGIEALSHQYGHTWWHDGILTVSSWAGEGWTPSGAMVPPTGASAGNGYGDYSVTMKTTGGGPGPFACVWPASDQWVWELDLVERDYNGNAYSTVHWDGPNGQQSYPLTGIDTTQPHEYRLRWLPGLLIMLVDGQEMWRTTEHVPVAHSGGGVNGCLGVGTQPAWAAAYQTGDVVVDVLAASFTPAS